MRAEWLRFLGANMTGGLVSYGIYALLICTGQRFTSCPEIAVAAGSVAGLGVNFAASKIVVFGRE